ncbi:MAG TPA: GAF domain-containing protein [Actinomycetota bacterium]|nr:GAF domain-containing protein [Actinomycetota bacterium]
MREGLRDPRLRLLEDLDSLWRLSDAVSRAEDLDEVLGHALEALDRTVGPDRAAVLLSDRGGVMRFRAWRGLSAAYRAAVEGHSPWQPGERDPAPVLVEDAGAQPALAPLLPAIEAEGIRALAFIPLLSAGRLLGKFMLYFDEPHAFTPDEVLAARAVASQVAFAVDRRRAEADLERSRRLLDVMTQGLADGITVQDRDGRLVYANVVAARMAGLPSPGALLATPTPELLARFEVLDEDGRPLDPDRLPGRRALRGEPEPEATLQVVDRRTGRRSWRLVKARPVPDEDGRPAFAVNVITDLTGHKELERDLRFQKTLLELQAEASQEGILVVSPQGQMISFNRRFAELWGLPEEVLDSRDDEAALAWVRDQLADPDGFYARVRYLYDHPNEEGWDEIPLRDGRVLERHTAPILGDDGTLFGRAWFFRDVTGRRREEERQRFLAAAGEVLGSGLNHERTLERIAQLAVHGLADWCVVYLRDGDGPLRTKVAHRDPEMKSVVRRYVERFGDTLSPRVVRAMRTGEPLLVRTIGSGQDGDAEHERFLRTLGVVSKVVVPLRARGSVLGAIVFACTDPARAFGEADLPFFMEVARRAAAAIDNAQLYRDQRRARREAERAAVRNAQLYGVSAALSGARTSEEVGVAVLQQVLPALGADAGAVYVVDRERSAFELAASVGYPEDRLERHREVPLDLEGPLAEAARSQGTVVVRSPAELARRWPRLAEVRAAAGDRASVSVPLTDRGTVAGVLHVAFRRNVRIADDDLRFIESVGRQLAQALDRAALYERERRTATLLQESLLPPRLPDIPGLEVAAAYLPFGEGVSVGGDLFDVFEAGDERWMAMMGDVSGRGAQAAATGNLVRQAVRVGALRERSPSRILGLVNRALLDQAEEEVFCTVCCVLLEREEVGFRATVCSAGHPLPLLLAPSGGAQPVGRPGGLLGVSSELALYDVPVELPPGQGLLLVTDGVDERRREGQAFGERAFGRLLASLAGSSAQEIVETLRTELLAFAPEPLADDAALLALRVAPA